jgi:outer membrane protein OmpA-like peptidoglycan-associated protein
MRIVLFLLFISQLHAQNLVVNGGFERQTPMQAGTWQTPAGACKFSKGSNVWNSCALGWRTFDLQTPDLLEWDSLNACPLFPKPRRGNRMAGLIMYHPFQDGQSALDYHEMMQGTLSKPMEKGKIYRISFWVYTDDSLGAKHLQAVYGRVTNIRPVLCGNFGFYFSTGKIQQGENFMQSQVDFPVKPHLNQATIVEAKGAWQKITLSFKADQPYKYFLFGNFFSDAITPIDMEAEEREKHDNANTSLPFWQKTKRIAYYLFDDFSIVEDSESTIEQALKQNKSYTFESALLFDTGKADLKSESASSINGLTAVLLNNPALKIEIGGHTDNVGNDQSNQTLSEQRAQSVYNALIAKQIPPSQISWKGYGESKPCATNDTETGRQKNRRVELRVDY